MTLRRFERFAWFFLAYLLAVILYGAWVRISGSGNGCGTHWPLCQGEVIPPDAGTKTLIEFTHRITSGLSGVLGIALVIAARRFGPAVYRAALAAMFFLLVEGFVGAVLVKKELVAGDTSVSRAIVIGLHLTNTMILTACAATVAWRARMAATAEREPAPGGAASRTAIAAVVAVLLVTSVTGGITALGDTLFPTQPALDGGLWAKVREDVTAGQHFLVRLRAIHPLVAMVAAVLMGAWLLPLAPRLATARWALAALGTQTVLGFANIALGAPAWLQIAHLLAAQILWIASWLTLLEPGAAAATRAAAAPERPFAPVQTGS